MQWTAEFEEMGGYDCMTAWYIKDGRQRVAVVDYGNWPGKRFDTTPNPEADKVAQLIAAAPRLLTALQSLAAYANGRLGKNPYCIPEYEEALRAIGQATGRAGDWMDANTEADRLENDRRAKA